MCDIVLVERGTGEVATTPLFYVNAPRAGLKPPDLAAQFRPMDEGSGRPCVERYSYGRGFFLKIPDFNHVGFLGD